MHRLLKQQMVRSVVAQLVTLINDTAVIPTDIIIVLDELLRWNQHFLKLKLKKKVFPPRKIYKKKIFFPKNCSSGNGCLWCPPDAWILVHGLADCAMEVTAIESGELSGLKVDGLKKQFSISRSLRGILKRRWKERSESCWVVTLMWNFMDPLMENTQ